LGTKLERRLRLALASFFFGLLKTEPLEANPFELCPPEAGILVVRQQNQMGDMLLATPCLRALRERLPESRITLLASHENEAVVRGNPHVDEVLVYDKRRFRAHPWALLGLLRTLRRKRPAVCIVLSTVSSSLTSVLLALLSGARYRLGYSSVAFGMEFADRAFHCVVPMPSEEIHQSRLGLRLLEHFGISTKDLSPIMAPSTEDRSYADIFLARASLDKKGTIVAIHPGAGKKKNRWPVSGFAQVANELHADSAVHILAMGGPSDEEVLDALLEELKFTPVVLSGQSIGRVAAVMKKVCLLICNDTGVLHVAASVGCPTLALFGPTDPRWWAPLSRCVRYLRAPESVMERLEPESVLACALEMISRKEK
jgi:ADP-heptose:LPS heptosyltransferase